MFVLGGDRGTAHAGGLTRPCHSDAHLPGDPEASAHHANGIMRLVRIIVGWLLSPRQLFALAGLCAAAGLFWGYANVHENASRTLALRQGPPPAIAIENFRGALDHGPAGEIVLHAGADLAEPLVLTLPRGGARALAVPLFPVNGGEVALGAILVLLEDGAELPAAAGLAAGGADGLVAVNGRTVPAGDFELVLAGALAVTGRSIGDSFVAVRPFLEGREAALQPVADPGRSWLWPLVAAWILTVGGVYRSVWGGVPMRRRPGPAASEAFPPTAAPAAGSKASAFAPLTRQEEVNDADGAAPAGLIAAIGTTAGLLLAASRAGFRGVVALLRLLRAGVGELRSPR